MSLDLAKLENVRERGGKIIARCPACAEEGHDEKGEHLSIMADGRFGCVVCPGEAGKAHRRRIAQLAGDAASQQRGPCAVRVRRPRHATIPRTPPKALDMDDLGRILAAQGAPAMTAPSDGEPSSPGIVDKAERVGRNGRAPATHAPPVCNSTGNGGKRFPSMAPTGGEVFNASAGSGTWFRLPDMHLLGVVTSKCFTAHNLSVTGAQADLPPPTEECGDSNSPTPVFCSLRSDLDRIAADLAGASRIALDIETYGPRKGDGLDPWKGDIRLLTLSRHGGTIWTIDLRATGYELGPLTPILEQATLIVHNAKFDLLWLRVKCGLFATKVACTLTAARLLAAGTKPGNNLDQCLERYLQIPPAADHSRSDWASMLLTEDQLAYAARDVDHLHDLLCVLEGELEMNDLQRVWALESELLPVVVKMEALGIRVDRAKLETIAAEADRQAQQAASDLRTALGNPSLNPASPGQVLAALRAKGITLESTAEEALKAADDGTIIPLVLAHREASKRAQQAEALVEHIRSDGRIHGRFEPLGTATGRFSSKEPNLQNIGRGELREAFAVQDVRRLVVADYSQIELRAAAAIAGETKMIDAYKAGADLHKLTASVVLGKPETDVTKGDRQLSKAVNFGLLYGQSAPGLVRYAATSYGVTMSGDQATAIRQAFFRTYSRLRQWHGLSHNQAEAGITEVRTRTGRRRLIPTTATDWERFTALVNTPVQGGTADGMKQALILIDQRLPQSARIVSTVHDEVVVECHEDAAELCREIITTAMVEAMAALFPEVPVEVEANVCTTWAEK